MAIDSIVNQFHIIKQVTTIEGLLCVLFVYYVLWSFDNVPFIGTIKILAYKKCKSAATTTTLEYRKNKRYPWSK